MSIVLGYVMDDAIVMCGDERICRDGNVHSEKFQKVYYLNERILFGFVGSVNANYLAIEQYLEDFNFYKDNSFSVDFSKTKDVNFNQFCESIKTGISKVLSTCEKAETTPIISIMAGGLDGDKLTIRAFRNEGFDIKEMTAVGEKNAPEFLLFGTTAERKLFLELLSTSSPSVDDVRDAFQETIIEDSKENKTINANMDSVFLTSKGPCEGTLVATVEPNADANDHVFKEDGSTGICWITKDGDTIELKRYKKVRKFNYNPESDCIA